MKCPECNGLGYIKPSNFHHHCPKCDGKAYIPMQDPEYFIEVYGAINTSNMYNSHIAPIKCLNDTIDFTNSLGNLQTIAIWKIKLKSNGN